MNISKTIQQTEKNLMIQSEIGENLKNANGKLLMRIANMCTWQLPNDIAIIKPLVTAMDKRKNELIIEAFSKF